MPRWKFWEGQEKPERPRQESTHAVTRMVGRLPVVRPAPPDASTREQRLTQLRTRREGVLFDVTQAELASRPDNPWRDRVTLLDETLAAVESDLTALEQSEPLSPLPLPETPITAVNVTTDEPSSVGFAIDTERFEFSEEIDWAERGGAVVRGDLQQRSGDVARLVLPRILPDRRDDLVRHLRDSVTVLATDLRDRALDGDPLPEHPVLADLARPCPVCGGWRDWRGTCEVCAARTWKRQQLFAEATRLRAEQTGEEEERHKWAERLPVARRRLAVIEQEMATLGDS
jgi:hypothetical protein